MAEEAVEVVVASVIVVAVDSEAEVVAVDSAIEVAEAVEVAVVDSVIVEDAAVVVADSVIADSVIAEDEEAAVVVVRPLHSLANALPSIEPIFFLFKKPEFVP